MDKRDNMPMKRTRPGNHSLSQTSIELCSPKHKSQMFQLISHHSTNGDVHRLSIGFTTCKLAGGASNSWEAWWLAAYCWGIEDSDRLQKICPDVRMSFHGLNNYCTRMDSRWYFVFSFQPLLERCLIRKHAFITHHQISHSGRSQGPEVPSMLRLPAGQSGKLKSMGISMDLSGRHWCYFVSSNPWKPFKHIEK